MAASGPAVRHPEPTRSTRMPLVTGAAGFAGSHLIDHLLEHEPCVAAWASPRARAVPADAGGRVRWDAIDITDVERVSQAIADLRPSVVYHCAGIADVHGSWGNSSRALRVNVMGTSAVMTALERAALDVPMVVTGSALVYRPSGEALSEESPIGPSGPYGVSKLAQEMLAMDAGSQVLVARPFNHAGPRQSDAYVTSSFARQVAEAEAGLREPVLRVGNLDARRDITDVRDTVRAYRLLVERGRRCTPYNVCSGQAYRVGELMELLVARARVAVRIEVDPSRLRPSDNPMVLGSAERLRRDTGWEPQIPIERTLDDLLESWRRAVRR